MSKAKFVFHGLFPDVVETDDDPKEIAKVLFDVEFNGEFHSHLLADIELIEDNGELEFEVRCKLPFICDKFSTAVIQYYQYTLGPQGAKIIHSGPKGASIATNNVMRAQWQVALDAS
jgi:hypothetical protein